MVIFFILIPLSALPGGRLPQEQPWAGPGCLK
jgi:hypothetical protein